MIKSSMEKPSNFAVRQDYKSILQTQRPFYPMNLQNTECLYKYSQKTLIKPRGFIQALRLSN